MRQHVCGEECNRTGFLVRFNKDGSISWGEKMCPEIKFEDVSPAIHDSIVAELFQATGLKPKDGEEIAVDHCCFIWKYDELNRTLTVTCTKKPFFVSCYNIYFRLHEMMDRVKSKCKDGTDNGQL